MLLPVDSVEINDADLEIGEEIKTGRFAVSHLFKLWPPPTRWEANFFGYMALSHVLLSFPLLQRILSGRWNDKTGDGSIRKTHSPFFKRLRDPKPSSPKTRDVAIKVVRRGVTNEDDLIEEAKVMM